MSSIADAVPASREGTDVLALAPSREKAMKYHLIGNSVVAEYEDGRVCCVASCTSIEASNAAHWLLSGFASMPRRNDRVICDNPDGPCACGAWHSPGERMGAP
jgi:hypothetical protein